MEFKSDTLIIRDTLKGFKTDTIFKGLNSIDTFYQDTGGIKVQTIVRWQDRIINQQVIKKDTIIKTKTITNTPNLVIKEVRPKWLTGLLVGLISFLFLLLFLVYALFKKK